MIILNQLPGRGKLPSISAYCVKIQTYLRFCDLPYEVKSSYMLPKKSPSKTVPFIEDDGIIVSESNKIIEYLKEKYHLTLDDHLTPDQHAIGILLQRSLEEYYVWILRYRAFVDEESYARLKKRKSKGLIKNLRNKLSLYLLHRRQHKIAELTRLLYQDTQDIYNKASGVIDASATILGEKTFLFSDQPSSYDATLYGFLISFFLGLYDEKDPLAIRTKQHANLARYVANISEKYYPG